MRSKYRMAIEEMEERGILSPEERKISNRVFQELASDLYGESKMEGILKGEKNHTGEKIQPAHATNIALFRGGGMGTLYIALQDLSASAALKTGLPIRQIENERRTLGNLEFSKKYGIGILSRLYLAKYLRESLRDESNDNVTLRFEREGRLLQRINHPRVPYPIYADSKLMVMTFYPHTETLKEAILARERTERELFEMVKNTVKISAEIHQSKGVILHRDLKPDNILVYKSYISDLGSFIIDWGLVKPEPNAKDTTITHTGINFGTPSYMPPEQAQLGISAYDIRSETYVYGIILWEALSRRRNPFFDKHPLESLKKIADWGDGKIPDFIQNPGLLNPQVPMEVGAVCLKALSPKKEDRFQSMPELYDALEEAGKNWLLSRRRTMELPSGRPLLVYREQSQKPLQPVSPQPAFPDELRSVPTIIFGMEDPTVFLMENETLASGEIAPEATVIEPSNKDDETTQLMITTSDANKTDADRIRQVPATELTKEEQIDLLPLPDDDEPNKK